MHNYNCSGQCLHFNLFLQISKISFSGTGWVQKRLIKHYIDGCKDVSETPNMKLLKKLYDLEVLVGANFLVS